MRNSLCHALGELAGNHVDPGDALGRANPGDKLLQSNLDSEIEVSLRETAAKLKPRWDVHLSGDDDQLG